MERVAESQELMHQAFVRMSEQMAAQTKLLERLVDRLEPKAPPTSQGWQAETDAQKAAYRFLMDRLGSGVRVPAIQIQDEALALGLSLSMLKFVHKMAGSIQGDDMARTFDTALNRRTRVYEWFLKPEGKRPSQRGKKRAKTYQSALKAFERETNRYNNFIDRQMAKDKDREGKQRTSRSEMEALYDEHHPVHPRPIKPTKPGRMSRAEIEAVVRVAREQTRQSVGEETELTRKRTQWPDKPYDPDNPF